jgi:hypothetical protein
VVIAMLARLAVDDRAIYVSAYRSDSLGVRRGPCRVIRIDLETAGPTGYVDVPSPCGTYEDGSGRLFHFTAAATLARLSDGETLERPGRNGADYPRPRPGCGDRRGAMDRAQRLELGHASARPLSVRVSRIMCHP